MVMIIQIEAFWVVTPFSLIDLADVHIVVIQNIKIWISFGMFTIAVRKNSVAVVWIKLCDFAYHTGLNGHLLEMNVYYSHYRYHTV
jgi:hypothetical protein